MISNRGLQVLRLRRAASQAAVSKFNALLDRQVGGRIRGAFQFAGASRTQRWAGRGLQLQNLKRPPPGQDNEAVADRLINGTFDAEHGGLQALEVIGGSIRAVIAAPKGFRPVVCDLASIESRVLGWLAGDPGINRVFAEGLDVYKDFASRWFGIPYTQVTKAQRTLAKPPSLGCGYGLGAKGLVKYADSMGVEMTQDQAQTAVNTFRRNYHEVPALWRTTEDTFAKAILGKPSRVRFLIFEKDLDMVTVQLPSGRKLYYHLPELVNGKLSYMGMNSYTHKWERLSTWGGKIVENLTQAVARDALAHGMLLADQAKLPIVLHVHDEIGCLVPEDRAEKALDALQWCMNQVPEWAPGLLLDSAGYTAQRYRKD